MNCFDSVSEGSEIRVQFTDNKGFDCEVTGEIVGFDGEFAVCDCDEDNGITRFRVSIEQEVIEILLSDSSISEHSVDEVEESQPENILESIEENIDEEELRTIKTEDNSSILDLDTNNNPFGVCDFENQDHDSYLGDTDSYSTTTQESRDMQVRGSNLL